jgi:hypothetical protein
MYATQAECEKAGETEEGHLVQLRGTERKHHQMRDDERGQHFWQ